MAERKALILDGGVIKELPAGDTLRGAGTGFRPTPDLQASSALHFYFGWNPSGSDGWRIRRQDRSTAAYADATMDSNPSRATLADAWSNRSSLTYGG